MVAASRNKSSPSCLVLVVTLRITRSPNMSRSSSSKGIGNKEGMRLDAGLVDGRAISRFGNRLFLSARRCRPGSFRDFRLLERFGGSFSKRRTGIEVGNVSDVPAVWFAVEDIDMVVLHDSSSVSAPTCGCSTCLLLFFLQSLGDPQLDH